MTLRSLYGPRAAAAFCLFLSLALAACSAADERYGRVKWVIDGDTVVLYSGEKVRYNGINAPEVAHDGKRAEPYGEEARAFNRRLVQGKRIVMVTGVRQRDQYGRILAYVYLPNGIMVNGRLLEKGLAHVMSKKDDDAFFRRFVSLQREAMRARRGIWSMRPRMLREKVVGNARSLRFHRLSCGYGRKIWPGNRRYFRSIWQAFWNGYSPCKKCRPWP